MSALEQEAYELAGQPFNLGSPKQIGEILFGKLGLPVGSKTASGAPSTDEDVLQELAADYPLPGKLLEHRSLSKLKGTYTDKLPLMVNPQTGRVHTNYAQAVAVTGRLSSNDPNLQNIPIRTAEGRRVREAFIAPEGSVILSADYSQIELRIMAHISSDAGLLRAFSDGIDVHRATAGRGLRRAARRGLERAAALRQGHQLRPDLRDERVRPGRQPRHRAQRRDRLHRALLRALSGRQALHGRDPRVGDRARLRRDAVRPARPPAGDHGKPGPRKSAAERQAINAPMQGTAADLIKLAMIAVQEALDREQRATRMIMQVHDELVFEVPDDELDVGARGRAAHHVGGRDLAGAAARRGRRRAELGRGALRRVTTSALAPASRQVGCRTPIESFARSPGGSASALRLCECATTGQSSRATRDYIGDGVKGRQS